MLINNQALQHTCVCQPIEAIIMIGGGCVTLIECHNPFHFSCLSKFSFYMNGTRGCVTP